MSSFNLFLNWFIEYYQFGYEELSMDFKKKYIKEILSNNGKYVTKKQVMDFDGCAKCGRCCSEQGCLDYDKETKLCTRHDDPISYLCHEYPWTGELGIAPLTLNCRYQVSFFVSFFDNFFQHCIDEGVTDA